MFSFMIHQPLLVYAFKVVACSAIFWLCYKGVIERGRHFALNRRFLLFALAASAVIPLISIPVYSAASSLMIKPLAYPTAPTVGMFTETTTVATFNPRIFIPGLYLIVCVAIALKLVLQLFALSKFSRSGFKKREGDCLIIRSPKVESPFSFIRTIYLPLQLEPLEETLFLMHEQTHIRNRHSLDVLFCEVLYIFFWFNPLFWFISRELKKIHEYQTDRFVVSSAQSACAYKTLIAKEFLGFSPNITNFFNKSFTKKRIIMLTQPFKTNRTVLRAALIIPIIALNLLLFSCTAKQQEIIPAQEPETIESAIGTNTLETKANEPEISVIAAEVKPKFQGGDEHSFNTWIQEQIKYPAVAKEKEIQGRVMLTFIVDTEGNVRDVAVLRGIDPVLDNEALRVVSSSPKWTPGVEKGQKINVRFNFPIVFQLK